MKHKRVLLQMRMMLVWVSVGLISGCDALIGPDDSRADVVAAVVDVSDVDWEAGSYVYRHGEGTSTLRPARVIELDVPEITQEIYDLGMVHVYFKVPETMTGSPVSWAPLPYQYLAFGSAYFYNLAYTYDVGTLTLYYFHIPNTEGYAPPSPTDVTLPDKTFKYVITAAVAVESIGGEGIDFSDHDAVMRHLQQDR